MKNSKEIKQIVKSKYEQIAKDDSQCCGGCGGSCDCGGADASKDIGYSEDDLKTAGSANLGLGCGNPVALSRIKEGDTVLDLGAGAGIDCFLAAEKVGAKGKVIGVDMTKAMVEKAKSIAQKQGYKNVEFILAEIENLPLKDETVDVVITNCVINLTPDKEKTFKEAYRVMKKGGRMYVSDIVLLKELSAEQKNDEELLSGCVAGALLKEDYLEKIKRAGFTAHILLENKEISKKQYQGIPLESLSLELVKE